MAVPTTALEVISLEEVKDELRLGSDTSQDTMLTSQTKTAVSWLEKYIGRSIIKSSVLSKTIDWFFPMTNDRPISFFANDFIEVSSVQYWPISSHITAEAAIMPAADLGVVRKANRGQDVGAIGLYDQYLADATKEWPTEILSGTDIVITYASGIDIDNAQALKQAVVVLVRQFYDGYAELRPNHAVMSLARPFQNWDHPYYGT